MSLNRKLVVLLVVAIVLGGIWEISSPPLAAQGSPSYLAVPTTPVVYDRSKVQVGLQLPDGNWAMRTIDQRFPCLGKISASVPMFSTVDVHLTGAEPQWVEVPVEFTDIGQTHTTRLLVVPEDWVINEVQMNVPSAGRSLGVESETRFPVAVVESVGTTPVEIQLPAATSQLLSMFLHLFPGGDGMDLEDALDQAEIPNLHVRWIPVSEDGRADIVSPDPNLPAQLQEKLGELEKVRVRIIGAGSQRLVP